VSEYSDLLHESWLYREIIRQEATKMFTQFMTASHWDGPLPYQHLVPLGHVLAEFQGKNGASLTKRL
jgi:hypothetical protein